MQLSVGPVLYLWSKAQLLDFYQSLVSLPVERVYLGETVCAKRRELKLDDWLEIAQMLQAAGKEVVLSSLNVLESESELKQTRALCDNGQFLVEANDIAAVELLSERQLPFVTGPSVNIYNAWTLKKLQALGLKRWVMPVELGKEDLSQILSQAEELALAGLETEVFAWGYLPLAYSARCFAARAHQLPKDDCQLVCGQYPDGLATFSQEGERLFTLNGIQTLSGKLYNLEAELPAMEKMGVQAVRLSPSSSGFSAVVERFAASRSGQSSTQALAEEQCDGYWYGQPGMMRQ